VAAFYIKRYPMTKRIIASIAFLGGGMVAWIVFSFAHEIVQSGMLRVGPGPVIPSVDALIPWFACSYFVLSAIGVLVARKRIHIWLAAVFSHLMLLITFCLWCLDAGGFDIIIIVFYTPWILVWGWILLARNDSTYP